MDNGHSFISFKLYHPRGIQVTFSLTPGNVVTVEDAQQALANVDTLVTVGFSVDTPGKPEGGEVEMIGWVSCRTQINGDGRPDTPILDLYLDNEGWNGRLVGIYLNTPEEITAFEKACGIELARLPVYDAAAPAKRDDARSSKYIVRLPRPAAAYIGENPRWEGENDKKNQKRKFFGWKDVPITAGNVSAFPAPAASPTRSDAPTVNESGASGSKALDGMPPSMNAGQPIPDVLKPLVQTADQKEAYQVVMKNRTLREKLSIKNAADFDNAIAALKLDNKPTETTDDILAGLYERAGMQYQKAS